MQHAPRTVRRAVAAEACRREAQCITKWQGKQVEWAEFVVFGGQFDAVAYQTRDTKYHRVWGNKALTCKLFDQGKYSVEEPQSHSSFDIMFGQRRLH